MSDKHTCPRRSELFSIGSGVKNEDTWRPGTSFSGHESEPNLRSCSYCGSIHPDDFMRVITDEGWIVGPTDKNYKAYLSRPYTEEEQAHREAARGLKALDDIFEGHHKGREVGKFYYLHLSEAQMQAFITLYNAKRMKVGYPGHFYRVPFFMRLGPKSS